MGVDKEDLAKSLGFCLLVCSQLQADRKQDVQRALELGNIESAVAPYLEQQKHHIGCFRVYEYHLARMRYNRGREAVEIRLQLRLLKAADNRVIREFAKTICAIRRAYRNQSER
jgi:hypothetical protein